MASKIGCKGGNCGPMFSGEGDALWAPSKALSRHEWNILSEISGTDDMDYSCLRRVLAW